MVKAKGDLVKEYNIGNTKIRIFDGDCKNTTKEDIEKILKNIANIGLRRYT